MKIIEPAMAPLVSAFPGLLDGNAGMAIVYALLARRTGLDAYRQQGAALLDAVADEIARVDDVHFARGLSGIGWAVEWLAQNGLLPGTNTDEVLEEVDDAVYKSVVFSGSEDLSLFDGALGKMAFFLKRAQSANGETHRYVYRRICHEECLVMLTDDLEEALLGPHGMKQLGPKDLGPLMYLLSSLRNINAPTVENLLYEAMTYVDRLLGESPRDGDPLDLLYLSACYWVAGKQHRHRYWETRGREYVDRWETVVPDDVSDWKAVSVYAMLHGLLPSEIRHARLERAVSRYDPSAFPPGLGWGRETLLLAGLSLDAPELIDNWHELFFIAG